VRGPIPSIPVVEVRLKWQLWFNGMMVYPFMLLTPSATTTTEKHEKIHYYQQDAWWRWAGPVGLLAWHGLYLLFLPFWWNPLRWSAEYEAYDKGSGWSHDRIRAVLTNWEGLYKLTWM
jgi:hypothetical protein